MRKQEARSDVVRHWSGQFRKNFSFAFTKWDKIVGIFSAAVSMISLLRHFFELGLGALLASILETYQQWLHAPIVWLAGLVHLPPPPAWLIDLTALWMLSFGMVFGTLLKLRRDPEQRFHIEQTHWHSMNPPGWQFYAVWGSIYLWPWYALLPFTLIAWPFYVFVFFKAGPYARRIQRTNERHILSFWEEHVPDDFDGDVAFLATATAVFLLVTLLIVLL